MKYVYLLMSEDTQDRRPRVVSVHINKVGAKYAKEKYEKKRVKASDGTLCPASDFGARGTIVKTRVQY